MGCQSPEHPNGRMVIITINLPSKWVTVIKKLTDNCIYPSRSEFVRRAVGDALEKEMNFYKEYIDPFLATDDVNTIRVPNGDGTYKILNKIGEA